MLHTVILPTQYNDEAPGHHPKDFPGNLLHFSSTRIPSLHPTTPGDIEVFKGMQIKELNLRVCGQLTGT